jgi:hypothetical protein
MASAMTTDLTGDDVATLARQQLDERQWNRALDAGWPPPTGARRPSPVLPPDDTAATPVVDMAAWRRRHGTRPGAG